jgi:death-on-curing protein
MKSHPFVGANEATALMALLRFLHINNAGLDEAVDTDLRRMAQAVIQSDLDREGLERWLRERLVTYA